MDTPVPIPNTEVKHRNGEGIRKGRIASCRAFFLFTMLYIKNKKSLKLGTLLFMVPTTGFEPAAYSLRVNCSTVGAMSAVLILYNIFKDESMLYIVKMSIKWYNLK